MIPFLVVVFFEVQAVLGFHANKAFSSIINELLKSDLNVNVKKYNYNRTY